MSTENQNPKVTILIATITVIGSLGAALFANWDKVFPPKQSSISQPTPSVSPSVSASNQTSDQLSTLPTSDPTESAPTPPSPGVSKPTPPSLKGNYSLAWVAQPGTPCAYSGSIADLTISSTGSMKGYLANNSPDHVFSGNVKPDGTWSATLVGGYEFNGTLANGELSGTYTVPMGIKQCQGKVRGYRQ